MDIYIYNFLEFTSTINNKQYLRKYKNGILKYYNLNIKTCKSNATHDLSIVLYNHKYHATYLHIYLQNLQSVVIFVSKNIKVKTETIINFAATKKRT